MYGLARRCACGQGAVLPGYNQCPVCFIQGRPLFGGQPTAPLPASEYEFDGPVVLPSGLGDSVRSRGHGFLGRCEKYTLSEQATFLESLVRYVALRGSSMTWDDMAAIRRLYRDYQTAQKCCHK